VNFPEFLDVEDVIALHAVLLDEHGGQAGIRDRGLLESAVAMPAATFDGVFLHERPAQCVSAIRFV
jgi:death-on-curing protein